MKQNYNNTPNKLFSVKRWFSSSYWADICDLGDNGCEISSDMMEQVLDNMDNLMFHLQNNSGEARIKFETDKFDELYHVFEAATS